MRRVLDNDHLSGRKAEQLSDTSSDLWGEFASVERYIRFIVARRYWVILTTVAVTAFFAAQLGKLHLEIRRRANLPEAHPYVQVQNRITDLFGGEAVVVIGAAATRGTIYTPEFLGKVFRVCQQLRDTPGVLQTSLFCMGAPYVKTVRAGADDSMDVQPLMEGVPTTSEEAEEIRRRVEADRFLRDNLVSHDGTATVIVVEFDDRLNDKQIFALIEQILAPERDDSVRFALAGAPVLRAWLAKYTALIGVLLPLAVVVIGLVHFEAFRTIQGMVLPLVTAVLAVVWSLGLMGLAGYPMDTWSALTPVVILAVAAGHAVQILKRYYEEFDLVRNSHEAIVRSIVAVGPVMVIASVIAAAGFASLTTFGITSVRVFGMLMASGILSALVVELTFTPACRALLPAPKLRETTREKTHGWLDQLLERLSNFVSQRPRTVLAIALALFIVAILGALRVQVDNSFRYWFSPATQVRLDDAFLNEKLPGTASLRILIEGEQEGVLKQPAVLQAISDLEDFLAADPTLGGISSIAGHVKRMHQAMNHDDPAFYRIPDNPRLISQYLLLYGMSAGPDSLSAFVDAGYQRAVIRSLSKTDTAAYSHALIARLRDFIEQRFRGLPVKVGLVGGTLGVQTAMNDTVVHDKIVNVAQIATIIFVLASLVLRSAVGGLFVLLPLSLAVAFNLGLMGWCGIWLDMTTAAITAMGVSIGADFAIYLIFRIREELRKLGDLHEAVRASLRTSGKAIFFVSSAVALGYMVLPFSGFSLWIRLGALTATIVAVSALGAVTIIPALSLIVRPKFLAASPGCGRVSAQAERAVGARSFESTWECANRAVGKALASACA
ncbi:MAG: MMPL family transporter [Candidatus Binatia bacterium]|nr:MMPL family transporter [Candidatus Binatia bacterium]